MCPLSAPWNSSTRSSQAATAPDSAVSRLLTREWYRRGAVPSSGTTLSCTVTSHPLVSGGQLSSSSSTASSSSPCLTASPVHRRRHCAQRSTRAGQRRTTDDTKATRATQRAAESPVRMTDGQLMITRWQSTTGECLTDDEQRRAGGDEVHCWVPAT